jgi:hypothetical protein
MANPNIVGVKAIYANNSLTNLSTNTATLIIDNLANSGKVYKINSIVATNIDGSVTSNITINLYSSNTLFGTAYPIANTIPVPINSTLVITDKSTSFYLKENQSVGATAASANDIAIIASWEELNS